MFNAVINPLCNTFFLSRVMDQHKMSKEEWEQSITTWWNEHKAMLRFVLILRLFSVGDVSTLMLFCQCTSFVKEIM
jgi:hypothetical protein